jgi:hypothetical protein
MEAIGDDFVDGLDLGEKTVTRVSNVEFDYVSQEWYAEFCEGFMPIPLKITASTRAIVLAYESFLANRQLKVKYLPIETNIHEHVKI